MPSLLNPAHPGHCTQAISTDGRKAERIWTPDSALDVGIAETLITHARLSKKERCGFLTEEDVWTIDNVHLEPYHNFYMDQQQVDETLTEIYDERGSRVIGVWHTHPNHVPWPSPRDLVGWPNLELNWRYWVITPTEVIEWRLICDNAVTV